MVSKMNIQPEVTLDKVGDVLKSNLNAKLPNIAKVTEKSATTKSMIVKLDNSKVKIETKQTGHKEGRMKVTFKLNKDEAEGLNNFIAMAKPEKIERDHFIKYLFFQGIATFQKQISDAIEELKKTNPEEYAKAVGEATQQVAPLTGFDPVGSDTKNTL